MTGSLSWIAWHGSILPHQSLKVEKEVKIGVKEIQNMRGVNVSFLALKIEGAMSQGT